jgi:KH domain
MLLEPSLHPVICGRSRKNMKLIESATNTAIYFPPPFGQAYKYCPPGAQRRNPEEIFITGENPQNIAMAKQKIHDLVSRIRLFMKDTMVSPAKIDSILLCRADKIRKIMETNGTFILFPPLASQRSLLRIHGVEGLHVERTVRDIMGLVCGQDLCVDNPANTDPDWAILQRFMVGAAARHDTCSTTCRDSNDAVRRLCQLRR